MIAYIKKLDQVLDKQMLELQNRISGVNKSLADCKMKKQELRNRINELRNPTLIAELNTFEQKRQELKETLMKLQSEISNIDTQLKNILLPEMDNIQKIMKSHTKEQEDFQKEIQKVNERTKAINRELVEKEKEEKKFMEQFKGLFGKRGKLSEEVAKAEAKINSLKDYQHNIEQKITELKVENAQVIAEYSQYEREFEQYKEVELIRNRSIEQLESDMKTFERLLIEMGNINLKALEIYDNVEKEYNSLIEKRTTLSREREDVLLMMNEIEGKKKELFMNTFDVVHENFKRIFADLSTKGDVQLELEDPENPFAAGVRVKVRLTGNKFLDIRSLSGGEKTLTALAFIFCIQEFEPASFYILDEVDAALDKNNSDKLARLIRKYSENAQYIVISHNDNIITEADNLYGVSMNEDGVSQVVSLKV